MKKYIFLFCFLLFNISFPQQNKDELTLSKSSLGFGFMISESGFGISSAYYYHPNSTISLFSELSISEVNDDKEFEFIDYWGNKYIVGKKNRIYKIPLYFGLQYRLFEEEIMDNFRPYISVALGPDMFFYAPYQNIEFFKSLKYGRVKYGIGGYIGFGLYFGAVNTLQGINIRYTYSHLFDEGIESLERKPLKDIRSFYIVLTFGLRL